MVGDPVGELNLAGRPIEVRVVRSVGDSRHETRGTSFEATSAFLLAGTLAFDFADREPELSGGGSDLEYTGASAKRRCACLRVQLFRHFLDGLLQLGVVRLERRDLLEEVVVGYQMPF